MISELGSVHMLPQWHHPLLHHINFHKLICFQPYKFEVYMTLAYINKFHILIQLGLH